MPFYLKMKSLASKQTQQPSLLLKKKTSLPTRTTNLSSTVKSNSLRSTILQKAATPSNKTKPAAKSKCSTQLARRSTASGLNHSASQSSLVAVQVQHVALTGLTPRQNRTEFPSVISCLQKSSSTTGTTVRDKQQSTGDKSTRVTKITKSATQSKLAVSKRDTVTTGTSSTTQNRKLYSAQSPATLNLLKKPVLQKELPPQVPFAQGFDDTQQLRSQTHHQTQEETQNADLAWGLMMGSSEEQSHLHANQVCSPDSLEQESRRAIRNQLGLHHTSSAKGTSSLSNTIAYFGDTTSMQPSGRTTRKENLHQIPYSQSTKLGSFQLQSGTRSDNDSTSHVGHSNVKTPFESTNKLVMEKSQSARQTVTKTTTEPGGGTIYAPPPTKQIKLTLSPVKYSTAGGAVQQTTAFNSGNLSLNQEYRACTKQMQADTRKKKHSTLGSARHHHLNQSKGDVSEDGQVQLSDLEPLSNLMECHRPAKTVVVHLTDLKKKTQEQEEAVQAGSSGEIQIQIQHDKSAAEITHDTITASRIGQNDLTEAELRQIAQCDASFESPDVLEAARRRGRSRCGGEYGGSSIQILPNSIIADKKTYQTASRKQILLQSAQSYMLMMSSSHLSSHQKPNPRIFAHELRSPKASAVEESLRWSVMSSQRRSLSEIPDEFLCRQQNRESKTIEADPYAYMTIQDFKSNARPNAIQPTTTSTFKKAAMPKHPSQKQLQRVPSVIVNLQKQVSAGSSNDQKSNASSKLQQVTTREMNLQAALLEIRRNSQRHQTLLVKQRPLKTQQNHHQRQLSGLSSGNHSEVSHLNMLVTSEHRVHTSVEKANNEICVSSSCPQANQQVSQRPTTTDLDIIGTQYFAAASRVVDTNRAEKFSSQNDLKGHTTTQRENQSNAVQSRNNAQDTAAKDPVTDWTQKLKDNEEPPSSTSKRGDHQRLTLISRAGSAGMSDDESNVLRSTSRLHCQTEMETQQTQIVHQIEGGIILTESCTDGEAIVAAETDEFYGQTAGVNITRTDVCQQLDADRSDSFRTSSGDDDDDEGGDSCDELPVDTIDQYAQQPVDSEPLETGQSCTENEDLILENVQNFINMAYLQRTYLREEHPLPDDEKVEIELEEGKRLLILDMDETLIHAATLVDIEINQVYGPDARPDFVTSFQDYEQSRSIEIGVFKRPYLEELIERALPHFQICIYTASERLYADAILDMLDPEHKIFYKRLYRDKCLKTTIPSPVNHPLQDLLPGYSSHNNADSHHQQQQLVHHTKNSESYTREESSSDQFYDNSEDSNLASSSHDDPEAKTVYVKDLRVLAGVDLSRVVIVDNQLLSFSLQPDNGIPISSYFFDPSDAELRGVADYLIEKYELEEGGGPGVPDIRVVNKQQFKLSSIIEHALNAQDSSQTNIQQHDQSSDDDDLAAGADFNAEEQMVDQSNYQEREQDIERKLQEQYERHMKLSKEITRQRLDQLQRQQEPIPEFNPDALLCGTSTPWQTATQLLNMPMAPSNARNANRYDHNMEAVYDNFAGAASMQTSQVVQDQTNGTLYSMTGKPITQGALLRQPLRTQVVTEVPESLETTQKMVRRRDCIFQPAQTSTSTTEEQWARASQEQKSNLRASELALKFHHQHSSSWNRPSESQQSGSDLLCLEQLPAECLESPTCRKGYQPQQQDQLYRASSSFDFTNHQHQQH